MKSGNPFLEVALTGNRKHPNFETTHVFPLSIIPRKRNSNNVARPKGPKHGNVRAGNCQGRMGRLPFESIWARTANFLVAGPVAVLSPNRSHPLHDEVGSLGAFWLPSKQSHHFLDLGCQLFHLSFGKNERWKADVGKMARSDVYTCHVAK